MKAEIHPDGTFTKPDKSEKKQSALVFVPCSYVPASFLTIVHAGLAGSKRKEVGVQEIDLDAEAAKQREAKQANLEAEGGSADGGSVVIPEGLILRPIRIERTSDDEEEIDPSGLGDGGENGDLDGTFDDEEEFESERLPSDEHQEPPPAAAPSLRSSQSFASGPGSSQADTIIID